MIVRKKKTLRDKRELKNRLQEMAKDMRWEVNKRWVKKRRGIKAEGREAKEKSVKIGEQIWIPKK